MARYYMQYTLGTSYQSTGNSRSALDVTRPALLGTTAHSYRCRPNFPLTSLPRNCKYSHQPKAFVNVPPCVYKSRWSECISPIDFTFTRIHHIAPVTTISTRCIPTILTYFSTVLHPGSFGSLLAQASQLGGIIPASCAITILNTGPAWCNSRGEAHCKTNPPEARSRQLHTKNGMHDGDGGIIHPPQARQWDGTSRSGKRIRND